MLEDDPEVEVVRVKEQVELWQRLQLLHPLVKKCLQVNFYGGNVLSLSHIGADNDPRIHDVMMRSIDANKSGLDVNILKYRFERLLLLDICKSNGGTHAIQCIVLCLSCLLGRLLMDVFDVTSWNTTPSYSNFTYLVNKNAVKKSPTKGTSAHSTPIKGGNGSGDASHAVHNEGVMEIHPIFFGDDE